MAANIETFANVPVQTGGELPGRMPCPFTTTPIDALVSARQAAYDSGLVPEGFRGRAGCILLEYPDKSVRAFFSFDPISDAASRPLEKMKAGYLWPGLEQRQVSNEILVNGEGKEKSLRELIEDIFAPYPDRQFDQGGKEQKQRRALWRRTIKDGLTSPCVKLVRSYNETYRNKARLAAMAEWWVGESPSWEIRFDRTFYAPKSAARFIFEWLLIGIDHDKSTPLQTEETAPPIGILYEDDALIVINKPSRLSSVPGVRETVSAKSLLEKTRGELFVVHRLDLDTSGVLAFAKTKDALRGMNTSFRERNAHKRYEARLEGVLENVPQTGEINLPLTLNWFDRPKQCVLPESEGGKPCTTYYEIKGVVQTASGPKTLVHLWPHTGRTHQLRLHCAHAQGLGCPIDGDPFYGSSGLMGETGETRLCLHAAELTIEHPVTGEVLHIEAPAEFPDF